VKLNIKKINGTNRGPSCSIMDKVDRGDLKLFITYLRCIIDSLGPYEVQKRMI
jgi:hypothetical protein